MSYKLLDLYCKAGGASVGYRRAGFNIVGVDKEPQPNYPFEFHQANALTFSLRGFDAYHASPPCQKFTKLAALWKNKNYPDEIASIRARLKSTGKPYVIENVPGAPLNAAVLLCGTMFNLRVIRHRLFECHPEIIFSPCACNHWGTTGTSHNNYHVKGKYDFITCAGHNFRRVDGMEAMGINWHMTRHECAEAIPPAYTEWIGAQLIAVLNKESGDTAYNSKSIQCGGAV